MYIIVNDDVAYILLFNDINLKTTVYIGVSLQVIRQVSGICGWLFLFATVLLKIGCNINWLY